MHSALLEINTEHEEESECDLGLTNSCKDSFPGDILSVSMVDIETRVESDDKSVDNSIDKELFGTKIHNSSIASKLSDTNMEDITKVTSYIYLT